MSKSKNANKDIRRSRLLTAPAAELYVREVGEGEKPSRTIAGYAILFNTPSTPMWEDEECIAREIIAPEAVTKELLDQSDIKFTMFHNRERILARSNKGAGSLTYTVDERGVSFEFEAPETADGDMALEAVRRGDIAGCSFMFSTYYYDPAFVSVERQQVEGRTEVTYVVRTIVGIYDFTLAADPAYPDTEVSARELIDMQRQAEPVDHSETYAALRREINKPIVF